MARRDGPGMAREVSQLCLERDARTNQADLSQTGQLVHPDIPAELLLSGLSDCVRVVRSHATRYAWHDAFDVSGNISGPDAIFGNCSKLGVIGLSCLLGSWVFEKDVRDELFKGLQRIIVIIYFSFLVKFRIPLLDTRRKPRIEILDYIFKERHILNFFLLFL